MAGRFRKAYVAWNHGFKQMIRETAAYFVFDFAGEPVPNVVHGQHHAEQGQIRVEPFFDLLVGLEQFDDAFQSEKFALQGNQQFPCRAQGVKRQQAQRRGAVQDDIFVIVIDPLKAFIQVEFAGHFVHQFQFHRHKIGAGR